MAGEGKWLVKIERTIGIGQDQKERCAAGRSDTLRGAIQLATEELQTNLQSEIQKQKHIAKDATEKESEARSAEEEVLQVMSTSLGVSLSAALSEKSKG